MLIYLFSSSIYFEHAPLLETVAESCMLSYFHNSAADRSNLAFINVDFFNCTPNKSYEHKELFVCSGDTFILHGQIAFSPHGTYRVGLQAPVP